MTSAVPPPAVPPSGDPEADARFAAYLADLAAHADDPEWGEKYREILADDPQEQREVFDLSEAILMNSALPSSMFVPAVLLTLALVAVVVVFTLRFVV
jgi:hypothetical protein